MRREKSGSLLGHGTFLRRIALLLVPVVAFSLTSGIAQQPTDRTIQQDFTSEESTVFDSFNPALYSRDFPWVPEIDPIGGLEQNNPIPMDAFWNPDAPIVLPGAPDLTAPKTPGDYDPEENTRISTLNNLEENLPGLGAGQAFGSNLITGRNYPIFHLIGKVVKEEAVLINQALPSIPAPLTEFGLKPARPLRAGPFRFAATIGLAEAYNNNVFGSSTNPQGDAISTVNPAFSIEAGTRGLVRLLYSGQFSYYQKFKDLNSANENMQFVLRYPFSKLSLGVDSTYQSQQGVFVNSNGVARQKSLNTMFSANYPFSPKLAASLNYELNLLDNDPGGFKTENVVSLGLLQQVGGASSVGVLLQAGNVQAPVGEQSFTAIQFIGSTTLSYHFELRGQAGVQARRFSPDVDGEPQLTTPVFDLTAGYYPTSYLSFILRAYRRLSTDTFENISLNIETGLEFSILAQFFQRVNLKIRMGSGVIEALSDTAPSSEYNFFQGGVTLSYTVYRMFDISVFSFTQQRFNDSAGDNNSGTTSGVALGFRF